MAKRALKAVIKSEPIRLDLCCGKNKKEGFIGIDRRKFEGVDIVQDLLKRWQWKDDTVAEVHMAHALEHFSGRERVSIFNEMYRVMQMGAKATIITPHWASNRAYGDFTHQWPPVSEMAYYYLSRKWRLENAPDTDIQWNPEGYACDFQATAGYSSIHPGLTGRADEVKSFALAFYKEAAGDMIATLVKV